ncbi:MAG: hypothetical protein OES47_04105 [Acidobacteriota bacterium]|nr:hypothetical protein [Acidobacteriota bacterium]
MRRFLMMVSICAIALVAWTPVSAETVDAQAAFDQLATLVGTWQGTPEGEGEEAEAEAEASGAVTHEIEVSANGTVVMETMNPGSPHEMINMYHLDGEDLLLTHYCAGGNQPRMRLNREASKLGDLVFDFDGGTNLDPETDHYIGGAQITLSEGRLTSAWTSYGGGEKAGGMTFHLARAE